MRILVCGGAGYIGSHLVRVLLRRTKHDVVILDSLVASHGNADHVETEANWKRRNPGKVPDAEKRFAALEVGDVRDDQVLDRVFTTHDTVDAVVHMCASVVVSDSVRDPLSYYDNNSVSMLRLLQAMRRHKCDKIIFSSTAALFGDSFATAKKAGSEVSNVADPMAPIRPDAVKSPENPYGKTKLVCEWMLQDSAAAYGIKSVSLRYFNACGACGDGDIGETHEPESHLIPLILRVPLAEKINAYNAVHFPERPRINDYVSILGTDYPTPDGTCIRDYVHVYDLSSAHILALDYLTKLGPADTDKYFSAFNLGTSKGYSVIEIVEAARRITGHPIPVRKAPRRGGDAPFLVASGEEAVKVLKWRLEYDSIDKIIASAWAFHKAHPFGYQPQ